MARIDIKNIKNVNKQVGRKQEIVEATYSIVDNVDERLFQIDTYGKDSRVNTGTASQTIQFDKDSAKALIKILIKEFSLLD